MANWLRDIRYGARVLTRNPGFTAVAVLSLAIGIGANSAVFSFVDTMLLRPLPVPRPADLLTVGTPASISGALLASYPDYADVRDRSKTFDGLAAHTRSFMAVATGGDWPTTVTPGAIVSGNFFDVMQVVPQLGRGFLADEDSVPGRSPSVILGHDFWEQRFAADPSVVGRTVQINQIAFTVVGVAPEGFGGADQWNRSDLFVPLMMWPQLSTQPGVQPLEARDFRNLEIRGRLRTGVTQAQAQAELTLIADALKREYPATNRDSGLLVRTELQSRVAQRTALTIILSMLMTLAASVLFVACANVAGLLTSRAPARAREIALRMAMGAGRARLVRQLVTENVLIALAGGSLGLVVAYGGIRLLRQLRAPADTGFVLAFELDQRALMVSLIGSLVSAVVFGLLPALRSVRRDLASVMKTSDTTRAGGRAWGRPVLVTGQVAIAVVLLVLATFISRGFQERIDAGPGYRTENLLLMRFDAGMARYTDVQAVRFFEQAGERVRSMPGVRSVGLASTVPMEGFSPVAFIPEGIDLPGNAASVSHSAASVDEHYFETIQLAILKGRGFAATDSAESRKVAVVNEQFAERYWPGQDPLGKRFRVDNAAGPWIEIVGVARNSKYNFLIEPQASFVYFPFRQRPARRMSLLIESTGDPASLATPAREAIQQIDPNPPLNYMRTMEEFYRLRVLAIMRLGSNLIFAMGLMGLGLAIVGLYGLVAYSVSRRTREIGIRMAIGADRLGVLRMVLRQAASLAVIGLGLGLAAGAAAGRALGAVFPGGARGDGRTDLVAFPLVAVTVLAVTLLAAYIPARRASRVSPTEALRYE